MGIWQISRKFKVCFIAVARNIHCKRNANYSLDIVFSWIFKLTTGFSDGQEQDENFSAAFCCFPHRNMNERILEFFFSFIFLGKYILHCNNGRENDKMHGYVRNLNSLGIWHQTQEDGNFDVSWSKLLPYILIISMNCHRA